MDDIIIYEIGETSFPQNWDYNVSVERMRGLVFQWKNISVEILKELYIAREKLSSQGYRNDLNTNEVKLGWEHYLNEIGLQKETVRRWLMRYNPKENVILPKEVESKEILETKNCCPNCGYKW
jgi:hypothetical protein